MDNADDFRTLELIENHFAPMTDEAIARLPIYNQTTVKNSYYIDMAMKLKKQKEASAQKETPFVVTIASCGTGRTRFVSARNSIDVKRALLVNQWCPNNSYFYEKLGLSEEEKVLAVLIGIEAEKSFWELTPADIGTLGNLRGFSDEQVIAILPDESIEVLFDFAFMGGEGEQEGNPGKEWQTITVEPLRPTFPSIYKEFDAANVITEDLKAKASACKFLYNSDQSTLAAQRHLEVKEFGSPRRTPIQFESKFIEKSEENAPGPTIYVFKPNQMPFPNVDFDGDDLPPLEDDEDSDDHESSKSVAHCLVRMPTTTGSGDMLSSGYSQKGIVTGLVGVEDDWGVGEATQQLLARTFSACTGSGDMLSSRYSQKGVVAKAIDLPEATKSPEPTDQSPAKPAAVKKLTWKPSYALSTDEVRTAAKSLIKKHKIYLKLTFFEYPTTVTSALRDPEIGWEMIFLNVDPQQTTPLTPEICQKSFDVALDQGLKYHFEICGTKSHDGVILGCNVDTESKCRVWSIQQAWTMAQQLTNNEAKVLSDLIRLDNKTIRELDAEEEYTADTIVRLLC